MSDQEVGSYRIAYDPDRDLVRIEYAGRLTTALLVQEAADTLSRPGITAQTRMLAICVDADISGIDRDALIAFQKAKADRGLPSLRVALVLSGDPGHMAMGRLWTTTRPTPGSVGAAVFADEDSATEWLMSGG